MLRLFSARLVELVVLLFAALGFMFVPLGKHTAFEHARAVLSTGAATEAGRALYGAILRVGDQARKAWQPSADPPDPTPAQWRGAPRSGRAKSPSAGPRDAGAPDVSL